MVASHHLRTPWFAAGWRRLTRKRDDALNEMTRALIDSTREVKALASTQWKHRNQPPPPAAEEQAGYVVALEHDVWLCDEIAGDPGRTLVLASATRYASIAEAESALDVAKTFRRWKSPRIMPVAPAAEEQDMPAECEACDGTGMEPTIGPGCGPNYVCCTCGGTGDARAEKGGGDE